MASQTEAQLVEEAMNRLPLAPPTAEEPAAGGEGGGSEGNNAGSNRFAVHQEEGRGLAKRLELRAKLDAKREAQAKLDDPDGLKAAAKLAEVEAEASVLAAAAAEDIEAKVAEENKEEAPKENLMKKVGTKMLVTTEGKLDTKESMRINALVGTGKSDKVSAFANQEDVTMVSVCERTEQRTEQKAEQVSGVIIHGAGEKEGRAQRGVVRLGSRRYAGVKWGKPRAHCGWVGGAMVVCGGLRGGADA